MMNFKATSEEQVTSFPLVWNSYQGAHVYVTQQEISHLHYASPQDKGKYLQQMGVFLHYGSDKNTIILCMHYYSYL